MFINGVEIHWKFFTLIEGIAFESNCKEEPTHFQLENLDSSDNNSDLFHN